MEPLKRNIVLFDGVCNLCNGAVQFIIKRNETIQFASLQSSSGQTLLSSFHLPTTDFQTMVYINGDRCFTKSTAVLQIMKSLGDAWSLLYVFIIIPRPIRDVFYNLIAQSRFKIWGMKESCYLPTPELRKRFLD